VTVAEAVTSFRTDTEPSSGGRSPIREGVYVYETNGFERADALTGKTHRYPKSSTITVTAADCGVSLHWQVLDAADGVGLLRERRVAGRAPHLFPEQATRAERRSVGEGPERWAVSCTTGTADETGVGHAGQERVEVGGKAVLPGTQEDDVLGEIRGFETRPWFDRVRRPRRPQRAETIYIARHKGRRQPRR
jgi:hypothetical protein